MRRSLKLIWLLTCLGGLSVSGALQLRDVSAKFGLGTAVGIGLVGLGLFVVLGGIAVRQTLEISQGDGLTRKWHRLKALWCDIWGVEAGPCIRLAGGLFLKIMEHCAELRGADGERQQLTHAEAAEFTRNTLAALASKDRREIALSDNLLITVDARIKRVPQSFLQKLHFKLAGDGAIVSIRRWSQVSVLSHADFEANLNEANGALSVALRSRLSPSMMSPESSRAKAR